MLYGPVWLGKDFVFLLQVMLCLLEAKLWDMWAGFDRVEDLLVIPANGFKTLTVSRL